MFDINKDKLVCVRYVNTDDLSSEYVYKIPKDKELCIGDIVLAPTCHGDMVAVVSAVDVTENFVHRASIKEIHFTLAKAKKCNRDFPEHSYHNFGKYALTINKEEKNELTRLKAKIILKVNELMKRQKDLSNKGTKYILTLETDNNTTYFYTSISLDGTTIVLVPTDNKLTFVLLDNSLKFLTTLYSRLETVKFLTD